MQQLDFWEGGGLVHYVVTIITFYYLQAVFQGKKLKYRDDY